MITSSASTWRSRACASAFVFTLACALAAAPLFAQGNSHNNASSNSHGNGNGKGKPPSRSLLPPPTGFGGPASTVPFAWVDDANLLPAGSMFVGLSMLHWQGSGLSETDIPVVDAALGVSDRLQIGATVPRVVGSTDPTGAVGGLGTTFVNAKVGLLHSANGSVKLAIAPTLEILGQGALVGAPPTDSRIQVGLPASLEVDQGLARVYASTGFFSRGVWFVGAGAGVQASPKLAVSLSFSRAWSTSASLDPTAPLPNRNEVSGGASYALTPKIGVFGSLGHTVATADENGAGATVSAGLSFLVTPSTRHR